MREAYKVLEGSRALGRPPGGATGALVLRVRALACCCLSSALTAGLKGGEALLAVAKRARLNSSLFPQAKRMSDGECISLSNARGRASQVVERCSQKFEAMTRSGTSSEGNRKLLC
ncbi:uncharacterized protein [Excalfactoria chinensis]|uniref:uncharacterized protein isoform X4 n=1 Tax=Excalfactoria chinensis TaxID=46218 RepID=UPI003B3B5470